ncbi:hypothetical protein Pelo_16153 [Pelomyxa schiedti]|nr:hypothetical protein Pelo_16153 [Pelomyxa schiedti]
MTTTKSDSSNGDDGRSSCHVVILCYSLTGNTRHAADKIAHALESVKNGGGSGGDGRAFTARVFEIVPVIKEMYYGGPPAPQNCGTQALAEALSWAHVVGCGTMCVFLNATGGISQFLCDLPPALVAGKPGFVFTTAGQATGSSNATLAESLAKAGVKPVLSQWEMILCPDTAVWCLPTRPKRLLWGSNVIETATAYGKQLGVQLQQYLSTGKNGASLVREGASSHIRSITKDKSLAKRYRPLSVPAVLCDTDKCLKCGKCAFSCPTNSMTFSKGEFPVWGKESCTACTACVANCPADALYVSGMKHKQFWRFHKENVKEGDNNWTLWEMRGWTCRSALWRAVTSKKLMTGLLLTLVLFLLLCHLLH